jgi:hypothetical protein
MVPVFVEGEEGLLVPAEAVDPAEGVVLRFGAPPGVVLARRPGRGLVAASWACSSPRVVVLLLDHRFGARGILLPGLLLLLLLDVGFPRVGPCGGLMLREDPGGKVPPTILLLGLHAVRGALHVLLVLVPESGLEVSP